jgi:hypothetical protein
MGNDYGYWLLGGDKEVGGHAMRINYVHKEHQLCGSSESGMGREFGGRESEWVSTAWCLDIEDDFHKRLLLLHTFRSLSVVLLSECLGVEGEKSF